MKIIQMSQKTGTNQFDNYCPVGVGSVEYYITFDATYNTNTYNIIEMIDATHWNDIDSGIIDSSKTLIVCLPKLNSTKYQLLINGATSSGIVLPTFNEYEKLYFHVFNTNQSAKLYYSSHFVGRKYEILDNNNVIILSGHFANDYNNYTPITIALPNDRDYTVISYIEFNKYSNTLHHDVPSREFVLNDTDQNSIRNISCGTTLPTEISQYEDGDMFFIIEG